MLLFSILLHVVDQPRDVVIVDLRATIFTTELDDVSALVLFSLNLHDLRGDLCRCRNLHLVLLEELSEFLIHFGWVNRPLDAVGDLPDMIVDSEVIDNFTARDHALEPIEEIWCGNLSGNILAAWKILSFNMCVQTECDDSFLDLLFGKRTHAVSLAAALWPSTDRLASRSSVDQAGHGHFLPVLGYFTITHIEGRLFGSLFLVDNPRVHQNVCSAWPQEWIRVEHGVDQALELIGK